MRKNDWQKKAEELLLGRKIVEIEWMSSDEVDDTEWHSAPICLKLDDGSYIFPLRDNEGNDGGSLAYFNVSNNIPNYHFPSLATGWDKK